MDSPVANLLRNDPGKQDVDPDRHSLGSQLKPPIAIPRHREGGDDQRQNGREATDREAREKRKGEAANGRHSEDRQGGAIGPLEEQGADQRADEEKGERPSGDGAQNEGIGPRALAHGSYVT